MLKISGGLKVIISQCNFIQDPDEKMPLGGERVWLKVSKVCSQGWEDLLAFAPALWRPRLLLFCPSAGAIGVLTAAQTGLCIPLNSLQSPQKPATVRRSCPC